MNRTYAAFAATALAVGAVVLTAPAASGMVRDPVPTPSLASPDWPDEGSGYPGSERKSPEYNYPAYKYDVPAASSTSVKPASVSVNDTTTRVIESGASALGGAAIALTTLWLVRRRSAPVS